MKHGLILLITVVVILTLPSQVHAQSGIVNPPAQNSCWGLWSADIGSNQYLLIDILSNNYSLYVFTQNQYETWSSGGQAYAIYTSQVTAGNVYLVQLPQGIYDVVLYPTPCGINVSAVVRVVNQPAVGITALGPITTNYVLAYINATGLGVGGSVYVILGSMVVVKGQGSTREYWVESSIGLGSNAQFMINIINVTGALPTTMYSQILNLGSFNQPIALYLAIKTNVSGGIASVLVGYSVIQNGSQYKPPGITWLSFQLINGALEAVIEMNPYLATAGGYAYDTELVVSQGAGSAVPMSVGLALLYWDGAAFRAVTDLRNYALNINATSTYLTLGECQGLPCVIPGQPTYGALNQFNASDVPMTYLVIETPMNRSVARYITEPTNITYPTILTPTYGTKLVLVGIVASINGVSEFVNSSVITIKPGNEPTVVVVKPIYAKYYLVSISSDYPINVNGTPTSNYGGWVLAGDYLVISAGPHYLGGTVRVFPINGTNLVIRVDEPLNAVIGWVRQYLVNITSPFPIGINGTQYLNYLGWVNACDYIIINATTKYLSNETRYIPTGGVGVVRVCEPLNITITWSPQYLVSIVSPVPIMINGSLTSNYTAWLGRGYSLTLYVPRYYYLGNGTRLVLMSPVNGSITVSGPSSIRVIGEPQYLVAIVSPVPVVINGTRASNYTAWVWRGGFIKLSIPRYVILPNLTLLVLNGAMINGHQYRVGSGVIVVGSPMNIVITYNRYYTVYLAIAFTALVIIVIFTIRFRGAGSGDGVTTV
jgi:thermopsin